MAGPVRTSLVPPRLASLAAQIAQLERSSRSLVFAHRGSRLYRGWGPPERPFVVSVRPSERRWEVCAWGCDGPEAARSAVREMFSLDDPLEEFYRSTRVEPVLRGTERTFRGLRLPRDASVHEALVHAIVGQQLSVASANALKRRLVQRYGRTLDVGGIRIPLLPTPEALTSAGVDGLRRIGLSRGKAVALLGIASYRPSLVEAVRLKGDPLETVVAELERLPGVGRWTAENALLRGTGRRDVFVAGDLGIRVALARYGAVPRAAREARARSWADRNYPGWGSYATLYLWRSLVASSGGAAGG